jgi:hypothetical protein
MNVAAERDDPTMLMARAHVGIDRPPRKNSSVSLLDRLSRNAATRPIPSIRAMYAPRTTQSIGPNAARGRSGAMADLLVDAERRRRPSLDVECSVLDVGCCPANAWQRRQHPRHPTSQRVT